jgi:hypothetical protein
LRLSTRTLIRLCRALGIALLAVGSALAVFASSALAQQEKENCPDSFFWERMSGQCCVQDRATLPRLGKIGYTGNSLCIEGYEGIYEHRPTTNGEGPPGCPGYTSFAYLVECVKPEEWDKRAQELAEERDRKNEPVGGAAGALYGGGGKPSKGQLAGAGAAAAALLGAGAAAVGISRGGVPAERRRLERRLRDADRSYRRLLQKEDVAYREREALRKVAEWYLERALIHLIGPGLFAGGSIYAGAAAAVAEKMAYITKLLGGGLMAAAGVSTEAGSIGDALHQAQAAWEKYKELSPKVGKAHAQWKQARRDARDMGRHADRLRRDLEGEPAWTVSTPFQM